MSVPIDFCEEPFKDFATGDSGDEVGLLARHLQLDERKDFRVIVTKYAEAANVRDDSRTSRRDDRVSQPDLGNFRPGTDDELRQLATARPYGLGGLWLASERGLLLFGRWYGLECYGVTDESRRIFEIRRIDGDLFPAAGKLPARKSHTIRSSRKSWPIGILEAATFPSIGLVEGLPDFLEAHEQAFWEQVEGGYHNWKRHVRRVPVAMLCSSVRIAEEALPYFAGKHVRIFAHADPQGQGLEAANRWKHQLEAIRVSVDIFDLTNLKKEGGGFIKDLYDLNFNIDPEELTHNQELTQAWRT